MLDAIFINPLVADAGGVFGIAGSNSIYVLDSVSGVPVRFAPTYSDLLVGSMARLDGDYYVTFSESGLVRVTPDGELETVSADYTNVTKLWVDAAGLYINDARDTVGLGIQLWASGASDPVQISASPTGDTSAANDRGKFA